MRALILIGLLLSCTISFAQYTPATVPNNKLVNNSYVSNPDGILSQGTVEQIDIILSDLEQQTTAQVAVVLLNSIGDATDVDFAQELYNLWGLGRANSNGLLILLVKDVPTIRFHTGYGMEGVLPDIVCKRIQREQMLPSFREGNYDMGILGGVMEVKKILTDPNYAAEIRAAEDDSISDYAGLAAFVSIFLVPAFLIAWAIKSKRFADSKAPVRTDFPQMRLKRRTWLIAFGGVPLLILLLFWFVPDQDAAFYAGLTIYLYFMATIFYRVRRERRMIKSFVEKRKFFEITDYLRKSQWYWFFMALIFPIPFIAYFPFHFVRKRFYRNHARTCKLCNANMIKFSEIEDDQHLTKNQQLEESIRSVDYDVWKCTGCNAIESWTFLNRSSKYKICPFCKTTAYYKVSDRTLESPTYNSTGKGQEVHECKACGKTKSKTYVIAKLTRSDSSSGSSSSGGGGSSSSGGSWGGGSSGGGGASSSW